MCICTSLCCSLLVSACYHSAAVLKEWSHTGLSGPLSVVKLFSLNSQTIADTSHVDSTNSESSMNYGPCVHILVCSAVELANVY